MQLEDIETRCLEIRSLHQRARYAIKRQSQADRSLEAFVRVNVFGFSTFDDEATRDKKSAAALKLIKQCRDGKAPKEFIAIADVVKSSDLGRKGFDKVRNQAELALRKATVDLPGIEFVAGVRGFGNLGFAQIIGECGNLSKYAGPAKVWKRLGLAPYQGLAMSSWKRDSWRPRALTGDEWIANPFKGERYAIVAQIALWLVNSQMEAAEKSGTQFGKPTGPYGEVYLKRRLRTAETHPDWTLMHARSDAMRITVKKLLADLWCAWNGRATRSMITKAEAPSQQIPAVEARQGMASAY